MPYGNTWRFYSRIIKTPYLKWIKMMEEENISDIPERKLIDGNIDMINYQGGTSGKCMEYFI